jgi:MFS family permease
LRDAQGRRAGGPGLPRRRQARALAAALVVAASGALPTMLVGSLILQISGELDADPGSYGLAASTYFFASASLSAVSGRLSDRLGWQRAAMLSCVLVGTCMAGLALVTLSLPIMITLLVVGGFGHAFAMPATNLALAREVSRERQALAFGIKQTSNPLAGLIAGASLPLVALTIGWRWAFGLAVLLPLLGILLTPGGGTRGPTAVAPPHIRRPRGDRLALAAFSAAGGFAGFAVIALGTFVVASAVASGVREAVAGAYVAMCSVAGLSMRVIAGWWADRYRSQGLVPAAALMAVGGSGFALLAVMQASLVLPAMLIAYAAGWGWTGLFHFGVVHHFPDAPGRATGTVQIGTLVGSACGPLVVGLMASALGYRAAWLLIAVVMVAAAGSMLLARRLLRHRPAPASEVPASL